MGRFVIFRRLDACRFVLENAQGRVLVRSKEYAGLDACKKSIASLVYYAPIAPVVNATKGESAPNPKIEITRVEGGVAYAVKSANGKVVLESPAYADQKACLRALSMLRTAVQGASVVLERPAGFTPLQIGAMVQDSAPASPPSAPPASVAAARAEPIVFPIADSEDEPAPVPTAIREPVAPAPKPTPTPRPSAAPRAKTVQRVHLPSGSGIGRVNAVAKQPSVTPPVVKKPAAAPQKQSNGLLSRFFKR